MSDTTQTEIDLQNAKMREYWASCYTDKNLFWQLQTPNPILVEHLQKLTDGQPKKFFMPLSGKSLDLPFLIRQGHSVFAVEGVSKAIEELSAENNLGLTFNAEDSLYSSEDGKLRIYCGDFTKCPIQKYGPFDCIWDRASFTAIDFDLRSAYAQMIHKSVRVGEQYHPFRYLMEVVDYDRTKFDEAPRPVSRDEMTLLFGWANFEVLEGPFHPDVERVVQNISSLGSEVAQVLYFLTPK